MNPSRSQSAEALTDGFYKEIQVSSTPAILVIKKKHFSKPWWRERFCKIFRKKIASYTSSRGKSQSKFQKSSQKEQEGRLGRICQLSQQQYTYKPSLEQSNRVEKQKSEKVNMLEVNEVQYKDRKSIANKIGETLAELSFPTKLRLNFFRIEKMEEQKTIHVNHTNKENYNKPFS